MFRKFREPKEGNGPLDLRPLLASGRYFRRVGRSGNNQNMLITKRVRTETEYCRLVKNFIPQSADIVEGKWRRRQEHLYVSAKGGNSKKLFAWLSVERWKLKKAAGRGPGR